MGHSSIQVIIDINGQLESEAEAPAKADELVFGKTVLAKRIPTELENTALYARPVVMDYFTDRCVCIASSGSFRLPRSSSRRGTPHQLLYHPFF
jgi:hypothetical protein